LGLWLGLDAVADELERLARSRLGGLSGRLGSTAKSIRALALGSLVLPSAVRARYLEEWLGELDVLPGPGVRARFACRILVRMPYLALALRGSAWTGVVLGLLRWILRSDLRTWIVLAPLLGWMVLASARNGLGDAVVVLVTVPPVLNAGADWLRRKVGPDDAPGG
jgi:hypothetical protein